ncbi:MAG TPA: DUF2339 domain-containing protein [Thermoanaerobaculia bacterium]|nr:DUF2339 domain-containing protein [Thermoanaerobaculia bacterium]
MGCFLTFLAVVLVLMGAIVGRNLLDERRRQKARIDALEIQMAALSVAVDRLRADGTVAPVQQAAVSLAPTPGVIEAATGAAAVEAAAAVAAPPPDATPPEPTTLPPFPATPRAEMPQTATAVPSAAVPAATKPRAPALPPPRPPKPRIEWERWVGVRGAALLGAIALALAGILFLRYSIETGLISPPLRVALGVLAGIAAIVSSEVLRRRGYGVTADGLAGAGLVMLYAAMWAARNLYDLVGATPAFLVFVVITAAGGVLSWRYRSLVIALLGLVGGFLTPILIASDTDNPIGLFSYLLLLNGGLTVLARRMRWPWLTLLGLGGTVIYQVVWVFFGMDPQRAWLGLLVLGGFAAFFVFAGPWRPDETVPDRPVSRLLQLVTQAGGVLTPLFFALYFAGNAQLALSLLALAPLLLPLDIAATWLARVHRQPALEVAAAAAVLGVTIAWLGRLDRLSTGAAWQLALFGLALALVHHLAAERDARARGADGSAGPRRLATLPTLVAAGGMLALLAALSGAAAEQGGNADAPSIFWIAIAGWAALVAILLRSAEIHRWRVPSWIASATAGVGFAFLLALDDGLPSRVGILPLLAAALGFAIALAAWAMARRDERGQSAPGSETAAALLPLLVLGSLVGSGSLRVQGAVAFHLLAGALALLVLLAALRSRRGVWILFLAPTWAAVALSWTEADRDTSPVAAVVLQLFAALLVTCWPFLWPRTIPGFAARCGAALATPLFFASLYLLWVGRFGEGAIGLLPLLFAGIALAGAALAQRRLVGSERVSALAWLGAVALGFVAVAVPLQLEKEWITIGWAVQAALVVLLWRRLDHPGLKYFASLLFVVVFARLFANPAVLADYPATLFLTEERGSRLPFLNWLLYTYLVPVAALVVAARTLREQEIPRLRSWEAALYPPSRPPLLANAHSLAAMLLLFAWLNLSLLDAFTPPGERIALTGARTAAQNLSLSLGWAVYALGLLLLGVARRSAILRWLSLAFLVLTIGKVFLYDLGELTDLYRVASLVGLAFSLILVSLLYQRFVFHTARGDDEASPSN